MSAAKHADLLFVKLKDNGENDLQKYCINQNIKHVTFEDFSKAKTVVESVVKAGKSIEQVLIDEAKVDGSAANV